MDTNLESFIETNKKIKAEISKALFESLNETVKDEQVNKLRECVQSIVASNMTELCKKLFKVYVDL